MSGSRNAVRQLLTFMSGHIYASSIESRGNLTADSFHLRNILESNMHKNKPH